MRKKQKVWPAFLVIGIMFVLIAAYVYFAYWMIKPDKDKICEGVFIEDVDISGMTQEQAQEAVDGYADRLSNRKISIDVNGSAVESTLEELGYVCDANDYVMQAMEVGKEGNLFANYAKIKQVEKEHIVYDLKFSCSEKKLKKFVKDICGAKCSSAKNSKIKMKNGELTYTEAKEGVKIDTETTIANLKKAMEEQQEAEVVTAKAVVTTQEPTVTKELASRCNDKIGTYTTTYNAGNVSRSKNLENAARLISGTVIYPGETFSVHDTISPLTVDNGYYEAPSYSNGQVVDSIGGGVCQVSTTLYNAVLRAELEVVERSPHSMVVSYVKPSMDAAIAGDYKDFKFRNNTDVPLYVQGGTYSGNIYFNIYGEETRSADRTVEYESEVTETIQPGADKITLDKTKPATYQTVTQEAHTGYKAVLWKIVTENGKSKKTQVNSSTYQAEPRYVTKGSAKATPKPTTSAKPKATATPKPDKKDEKPAPTAEVKATEVPAAGDAPTN